MCSSLFHCFAKVGGALAAGTVRGAFFPRVAARGAFADCWVPHGNAHLRPLTPSPCLPAPSSVTTSAPIVWLEVALAHAPAAVASRVPPHPCADRAWASEGHVLACASLPVPPLPPPRTSDGVEATTFPPLGSVRALPAAADRTEASGGSNSSVDRGPSLFVDDSDLAAVSVAIVWPRGAASAQGEPHKARGRAVVSRADGTLLRLESHGAVLVDAPPHTAASSSTSVVPRGSGNGNGGGVHDGGGGSGDCKARAASMHSLWRAPTDNDRGGVGELLSMSVGPTLAKVLAPALGPVIGWHFRTFEPLRGPLAGHS